MSIADAVARIAGRVSARHDGPYHPAVVRTITDAVYDAGGSITAPGDVTERPCLCQVDGATEAMRGEDGYTDKDVRLLLIQLEGALDTDATVEVTAGPQVGRFSIQSVGSDAFAIYRECRGRPA